MTREEFIEMYQLEDDCIILEPWEDFKDGIVGVTEDRTQIIYSYQGMVESLARSYEKEYWEQHKDETYDEPTHNMLECPKCHHIDRDIHFKKVEGIEESEDLEI